MTTRPEHTLAEAALFDALAVRQQAAEFQRVADAQRAAIAQHIGELERSATQAVGLAAEFERRLADLADYADRLAERSAKLERLAVARGGVQLEGTADGGVVVVVYEAPAENAAIIRTVAFTPQEVMLSVAPPPRPRVEPAPPLPEPEVEPAPAQSEVAPARSASPPAEVVSATVGPPQPMVGSRPSAAPTASAGVRFLWRLAGAASRARRALNLAPASAIPSPAQPATESGRCERHLSNLDPPAEKR